MGCGPIIDGVAGGAASGVEPQYTQRKQYQNSLADISARSIPDPIGFWDFNQDNVEAVTGGAGYDFVRPGVSGYGSMFTYVDGDIGVDAVYGGFWDRTSMAEVNNAGVWRLDSPTSDMSASLFFRCNQYEGSGSESQRKKGMRPWDAQADNTSAKPPTPAERSVAPTPRTRGWNSPNSMSLSARRKEARG